MPDSRDTPPDGTPTQPTKPKRGDQRKHRNGGGEREQQRTKRGKQVECTTYLPTTLKARVVAQVAREGRSESDIVREALRQYYAARAHPAAAPSPSHALTWSLPSIPELVIAAGGEIGSRTSRRRRRRRRRRDCCCCRRVGCLRARVGCTQAAGG
jgi:hypothetical protein